MKKIIIFIGLKIVEVSVIVFLIYFLFFIGKALYLIPQVKESWFSPNLSFSSSEIFWGNVLLGLMFSCGLVFIGILIFLISWGNWELTKYFTKKNK